MEQETAPGEIWKMHPYGKWVSNMGRVKHVYNDGKRCVVTWGRFCNHCAFGRYAGIGTPDGKGAMVHDLVMDVFGCEKPEGGVAGHINGDCLDNRIENLSWGVSCKHVQRHIKFIAFMRRLNVKTYQSHFSSLALKE